jgi:hypothetical protein
MHTIVGSHLISSDGEDVGEIVDVVGVRGPELTPTWVTVKTGWFAQRLVPFDMVDAQGDGFQSTCSAGDIKDAPKVPVHFEPAGDDLDELCAHYGLAPERV